MLDPWEIAAILSGSVALEAASPGKPGSVSSWVGSGGLDLADFIFSVPYLARALTDSLSMPACNRVVRVLKAAAEIRGSRVVGKNTVSGYVVLTAPLTAILEELGNEGLGAITVHWGTVEACLRSIRAGELFRAVSGGGVRHLHGFVGETHLSTLLDEYSVSSLYDINCWEVISRYSITREAAEGVPCDIPPHEAVRNIFFRIGAEFVDTSVLKSLGSGWGLVSREAIVRGGDEVLRTNGVNLGSIADLTALATAFWVIRCAGNNR